MKAFVVKEYAHPSKIPLSNDFPEPKPGPGQVLVDVYSAGLNFFDILQAQGKYQNQPPFPFVLGAEFAGKISSNSPIPSGCPLKPGDRVFGAAQGAFAEEVAVDWTRLQRLPPNMSYNQGAGLYVTWPTSYTALVDRAHMKSGEWVLVTAAAGGVGIAAVQIAKLLGGRVIAAAGSQAKLEIAKKYGGADYVIDYTKKDWQKEVLKITGGKGVDIIYDPVGMIQDCLKCIAWKGRAIVVGFAGGRIEKVTMNIVLLKNVSIVGLHWGAYALKQADYIPVVWKEVLELLSSGRVQPVVYSDVYPLEKTAEALQALEDRKTWGKAIIQVREDSSVKAKL